MAKHLQLLREHYQLIEDRVIPQLTHAGLTFEARERLVETFRRMGDEPVSLPFLVEMRKHLSMIRRAVTMFGADVEIEQRECLRRVDAYDQLLLVLQQYIAAKNA